MVNRGSDAWDVSAAEAMAVPALSEYIRMVGDNNTQAAATATLDGEKYGTTSMGGANQLPQPLSLSASQLAGHKELEITESGTGTVYVDLEQEHLMPMEQTTPKSSGIAVDRHYVIAVEDPSQAEQLTSGSSVTVQLNINADTDYRYVQVEDALPVGSEVKCSDDDTTTYPVDSSDGTVSFVYEDVRDDRVVFSFDNLPKGHTFLSLSWISHEPAQHCPKHGHFPGRLPAADAPGK
jgi:uncharacterized protein YfaS (alpha-2-macroglobulin family)